MTTTPEPSPGQTASSAIERAARAYDPKAFEEHTIERRSHLAAIQWEARRAMATEAATRLAAAGLLLPECDCDAPLTHLAEEIPDECPAHPRSDLRAVRAATLVPTTARNRKYSEGYAQAMADIRAACAAIDIYGPAHYLGADRG